MFGRTLKTRTRLLHSEERSDEESRFAVGNCQPRMRFFAEFTLSEILRSLCWLRMTGSEGLRMRHTQEFWLQSYRETAKGQKFKEEWEHSKANGHLGEGIITWGGLGDSHSNMGRVMRHQFSQVVCAGETNPRRR